MANPDYTDMAKIERIAKYLNGARKRVFQSFDWNCAGDVLDAYSDSDWAGCKKTRKSTSGGIITWGSAILKTWSSTQRPTSLSSQAAELYACTKTLSEMMGIRSIAKDFGFTVGLKLYLDAKAVHDLAHRIGLGNARHIETADLWLQQALEYEQFELYKISGLVNPAGALTKPLGAEDFHKCMDIIGLRFGPLSGTSESTSG